MKKQILLLATFMSMLSFANAQWVQLLDSVEVDALALKGDTIFAGVSGGVDLSSNNGSSWVEVDNGIPQYTDVVSLTSSGSNIFIGIFNVVYFTGGVYLSSNNGGLWTAVNTGLTNNNVNEFATSGNKIFAGTNSGVFFSSNNGGLWTKVINGLTDTNVTALAISDSNIFVGTDGSGIFLSSNDGQLWDSVNTGLPANTIVLSFAISGNNIFAGTNNNGVFLSTNNGSSWTAVNGGLLDNTGIGALAIKGSNIFAGVYNWQTGNWGVYLSSNNGVSWNSISYGLINSNILVLATNDSNIFVGTYFGLWKLPLSEMGIKELNNNTSNIAVYPNPATNNIIIETLQKSTIEILNIQGQTVIQQQIQQGKTDIDISGLAKGVYILRLCSNDKTEVARIVKE